MADASEPKATAVDRITTGGRSAAGATTPARTAKSWRLGGGTRKTVLVIHIASVGAWLGLDVAMALLVFSALLTDDPGKQGVYYQALELVTVWPMTVSALVCLLTGILLGLGSKYGLIKYWWVAIKLVLNLLLTVLLLIALRPGVALVAEEGRKISAGESGSVTVGDLIFPPIVSPTLLMVAVVLSVFKPWGRLRRQPQRRKADPAHQA